MNKLKKEYKLSDKYIVKPIIFIICFDISAIIVIQIIEWIMYNGIVFSGMCPGAPTDIPPYPCNIISWIVERGLLNPWAIPAHILLMILGFILAYGYLILEAIVLFLDRFIKKK